MTQDAAAGPIRTTLIDVANCIGCRACQVACKQWNGQEGEETELEPDLGFQNPAVLSAKTYTIIAFHEMENPQKPDVESAYVMQRCLHCLEPACVSACPTTALYRQTDGPVSYDVDECIGCRYCMLACPWDVPTAEWDTRAPTSRSARTAPTAPLRRCRSRSTDSRCPTPPPSGSPQHCDSRLRQGVPRRRPALRNPGGDADARAQADCRPTRQVRQPRLRREGARRDEPRWTCRRCRSNNSASRTYGEKPFPAFQPQQPSGPFPPFAWRRVSFLFGSGSQAVADGSAALKRSGDHGHVEFEPLRNGLMTPVNLVLPPASCRSAASLFLARFARGARRRRRTSPTPTRRACGGCSTWCGSRMAARAFAIAGVGLYSFQRKDLLSSWAAPIS